MSVPTGWLYYYGMTPAQLNNVLSAGTYRIVDLQVESATTSGPVFTVALVANTGSYAKGWWWYYGQSIPQVSAALSANSARLISIAPYVVNGTTYYASVMVPNTGADAKGWYWWVGTASQINADVSATTARLVDLEPFATSSGTQYAAIAISNTGTDADSWWWYLGDTAASLLGQVNTNKAQILTFDTEPGSTALDATMQRFHRAMVVLHRHQRLLAQPACFRKRRATDRGALGDQRFKSHLQCGDDQQLGCLHDAPDRHWP